MFEPNEFEGIIEELKQKFEINLNPLRNLLQNTIQQKVFYR